MCEEKRKFSFTGKIRSFKVELIKLSSSYIVSESQIQIANHADNVDILLLSMEEIACFYILVIMADICAALRKREWPGVNSVEHTYRTYRENQGRSDGNGIESFSPL